MPAPASVLIDVDRLIAAYHEQRPDASIAAQRVAFGTSGHRGSSLSDSFNEWHVLAISQALCDHRRTAGITGPLYMGMDTHALSRPACGTALDVFAANGVQVLLATGDEYTPTPAVSHAILAHNRGRSLRDGSGLADGVVLTPSHNPPRDGGYKYNPPHGGPAGQTVTDWIGARANRYLELAMDGVHRLKRAQSLHCDTTHRHDFRAAYVADLGSVLDMALIRDSKLRLAVHPLGGAGVHYWAAIADRYGIDLTVLSEVVDPTFAFMTLDWDGQIRMDPSSKYAMQVVIKHKDEYDLAFACDTDHDRHGVVTPSGLMAPNDYLSVAVDELFRHRPNWQARCAVGKTLVSTSLIDRVARRLGRNVYEVPVGFKWFCTGLLDGALGFGGEESAGASFLRRDGRVWTTDKDGLIAALLAAEITARAGHNPSGLYETLTLALGRPCATLIQAPASAVQRQRLARATSVPSLGDELAGDRITGVLSRAPGNGVAIGGIKVLTAQGWFAARPSGTEPICKIYAETFGGPQHLLRIVQEARRWVGDAIAGPPDAP